MSYSATNHHYAVRPSHPLWERGPNPRHSMSLQNRKGLLNNPGENNCFLNSAVQVLWHLDVFRRSFRLLTGHACMGNSCIFCALKVIFTQFQYSDQDALPPDALRKALAETFADQERFQIGVMDDAAECFENMLFRIHFHIAGGENEDMCNARHCIPHQKFAMTIVEQYVCECGATSEPLPFSQMVHYVSTSALTAEAFNAHKSQPPRYFGELLKCAGTRGDMDKECPSKCGKRVKTTRTLTNAPDVVSIGLVWDSDKSDVDHIRDVVSCIGTSLYTPDLYHSVVDVKGAPELNLVGIVCYYGKHYSTFFYNSKSRLWVYFDDATVKEIGRYWEKVADKICRGRYQPLLLLYANPYGQPVDISSALQLTTMVPGHSWSKHEENHRQDTLKRRSKSREYSQYGGQDRTDGSSGHWNQFSDTKIEVNLSERRAITPNPESNLYKKDKPSKPLRSITPCSDNAYIDANDEVVHERQPSYITAIDTRGDYENVFNPTKYKLIDESHTDSQRTNSMSSQGNFSNVQGWTPQYNNSNSSHPQMNGFKESGECGVYSTEPNDNTGSLISFGNDNGPMFTPAQNGWVAPQQGMQEIDYDSYTLSNSDQYRRPTVPQPQTDAKMLDKKQESAKVSQKKTNFKGGKGRKKVGADVIRYQTSTSFDFQEVTDNKENQKQEKVSVKRMHSTGEDQGFVNKHDSPITSGLATLPRNRKPKKNKPEQSGNSDSNYMAMHQSQINGDYMPMSNSELTNSKNTSNNTSYPGRIRYEDDLDEPIYIDRKTVESILNRQNVQLKRQVSGCSAASKESRDSGHLSGESYSGTSKVKSKVNHSLKVEIPPADNVSIGSHKDSGYRSGDRNSASSIGSLSMESSPTVDTMAGFTKGMQAPNSSKDMSKHNPMQQKLVKNLLGVNSDVTSFSSSVESLSSSQSNLSSNQYTVQKPSVKSAAFTQGQFPDAKTADERCEQLCRYAEELIDKSVAKEQECDLPLALVLCNQAISYLKQAIDCNSSDQQFVHYAHVKHNTSVMRSRTLHRRFNTKQDNQSLHCDTSLEDQYRNGLANNRDLIQLNEPPKGQHELLKEQVNKLYSSNNMPKGNPGYQAQVRDLHAVSNKPPAYNTHQQPQVQNKANRLDVPSNNSSHYNRQHLTPQLGPKVYTVQENQDQGRISRQFSTPQLNWKERSDNLELRDYAKCQTHASDVKLRQPLMSHNLQMTLAQSKPTQGVSHTSQSSTSSGSTNTTVEVYATLPRQYKDSKPAIVEKPKKGIEVYRSYLSRQRSQINASQQGPTSVQDKAKPSVPKRSDSLTDNSTPFVKSNASQNIFSTESVSNNKHQQLPIPVSVEYHQPVYNPTQCAPSHPGNVHSRQPSAADNVPQASVPCSGQAPVQYSNQGQFLRPVSQSSIAPTSENLPQKQLSREGIKQLLVENMRNRQMSKPNYADLLRQTSAPNYEIRHASQSSIPDNLPPKQDPNRQYEHSTYGKERFDNASNSYYNQRNGNSAYEKGLSHYDYPEKYHNSSSYDGTVHNATTTSYQRGVSSNYNSNGAYHPVKGMEANRGHITYYGRDTQEGMNKGSNQQTQNYQRGYDPIYELSQSIQPTHSQPQPAQPINRSISQPAFQKNNEASTNSSQSHYQMSSKHDSYNSSQSHSSSITSQSNFSNRVQVTSSNHSHYNPPYRSVSGQVLNSCATSVVSSQRRHPSESGPRTGNNELRVGGELKRYKSTPVIGGPEDQTSSNVFVKIPSMQNSTGKGVPEANFGERLRRLENQQIETFSKQQTWFSQHGNEGIETNTHSSEVCPGVNSGLHQQLFEIDDSKPPPLPEKTMKKSKSEPWLQLNTVPSSGVSVEEWLKANTNQSASSHNANSSVRDLRSKFEKLTTEIYNDDTSLNSSSSDNKNSMLPKPLAKKKKPKRKKSVTFSDTIGMIADCENIPADFEYILEWALKCRDRFKEGKYVILSKQKENGDLTVDKSESSEGGLGYDSDCEDNTSDSCDSADQTGSETEKLKFRCCLCRKKKIEPGESYCDKCNSYFDRLQKSSV